MKVKSLTAMKRWIPLPPNIVKAFSGKSGLPIHELEKAKVQKPHAHIRPFPDASANIKFSAWRLAHAIKKADCLNTTSTPDLWTGTVGFILENSHLFDWGKGELSLHHGMASHYADFSRSSLAGRIAQGMALLFLEEKGYAYLGRFETVWKKHAAAQNKPWPSGKKKAPDFIGENAKKEWVLAESKGGFAKPKKKSDIKGVLSDGLDQLDGWDKQITPQPKKSFAVGTFLRESGDPSDERSMIAFVDPEPEPPENPVQLPADAVRRANFGAWLSFMGFDAAANRLRMREGDPERRQVPVVALGSQKFAVSITSITQRYSDLSSREFWDEFEEWLFFPFDMPRGGIRLEVVGLDLKVFEALRSGTDQERTAGLMELKPGLQRDESTEFEGGAFYGSVLSDGSLLGELRFSRTGGRFPSFEWVEVEL